MAGRRSEKTVFFLPPVRESSRCGFRSWPPLPRYLAAQQAFTAARRHCRELNSGAWRSLGVGTCAGDARSEGDRAAAGRDAVHASPFHFKWGGWQWVYADIARPTCQMCWLLSKDQAATMLHECGSGGGGGATAKLRRAIAPTYWGRWTQRVLLSIYQHAASGWPPYLKPTFCIMHHHLVQQGMRSPRHQLGRSTRRQKPQERQPS